MAEPTSSGRSTGRKCAPFTVTPGLVRPCTTELAALRLESRAVELGARKAELLHVSVPSHCPLLQPIAKSLREQLRSMQIRDPQFVYVSNVKARAIRSEWVLQQIWRTTSLTECDGTTVEAYPVVSGGPDECLGPPAGFLQAGAPAVVSTLWPVSDLSTMLLIERFYQLHIKDGQDLPETTAPSADLASGRDGRCVKKAIPGRGGGGLRWPWAHAHRARLKLLRALRILRPGEAAVFPSLLLGCVHLQRGMRVRSRHIDEKLPTAVQPSRARNSVLGDYSPQVFSITNRGMAKSLGRETPFRTSDPKTLWPSGIACSARAFRLELSARFLPMQSVSGSRSTTATPTLSAASCTRK